METRPQKQPKVSFLFPRSRGDQHCGGINALCLSDGGAHWYPSGNPILWSASRDGTVLAWDSQELRPVAACLDGHTDWVTDVVVLDPSEPLLATGSSDRTLRIWRSSDTVIHMDTEHSDPIASPFTQLQCVAAVAAHPDVITCLAAKQDVLVSAGLGGQVRLWDAESMRSAPAMTPGPDLGPSIYAIALDPSGDVLAAGSREGRVDLVDTRTKRLLWGISAHSDVVRALAFSSDGGSMLSAGSDGLLRVWDLVAGGRCRATLAPHPGPIWALTASPDLSVAWTGGRDGSVYRSTLSDGKTMHMADTGDPVSAVVLDPAAQLSDNNLSSSSASFWTASPNDSRITRWRLEDTDRSCDFLFPAPASVTARRHMSFDPETGLSSISVMSGQVQTPSSPTIPHHSPRTRRHAIYRHPPAGVRAPAVLSTGLSPLTSVQPTTDRLHLLTQCKDGTIELWSVSTGNVIQCWSLAPGETPTAALLRARRDVFDPGQAVSAWFSPSIKLGSPGGTLEATSVLGAEAYLRALGVDDAPADAKVDAGFLMLKALFPDSGLLGEKGDDEELQTESGLENTKEEQQASHQSSENGVTETGDTASTFAFCLGDADVMVLGTVPLRRRVTAGALQDAPEWVRRILRKGQAPVGKNSKMPFGIFKAEGSGLPSLLQSRLHAPRVLCIDKVADYVCKRLRTLGIPECEGAPIFYSTSAAITHSSSSSVDDIAEAQNGTLENNSQQLSTKKSLLVLTCNGVVVPWEFSLAAVRQWMWKRSDDLVLNYNVLAPGSQLILPVISVPASDD